jgi:hypothetical protein
MASMIRAFLAIRHRRIYSDSFATTSKTPDLVPGLGDLLVATLLFVDVIENSPDDADYFVNVGSVQLKSRAGVVFDDKRWSVVCVGVDRTS